MIKEILLTAGLTFLSTEAYAQEGSRQEQISKERRIVEWIMESKPAEGHAYQESVKIINSNQRKAMSKTYELIYQDNDSDRTYSKGDLFIMSVKTEEFGNPATIESYVYKSSPEENNAEMLPKGKDSRNMEIANQDLDYLAKIID